MRRLFRKDQILTLPNLLSLLRLALIPMIVWLYMERHNFIGSALLILVSGVTDVADGIIARKFHMVSDLGKILDPIADKLTQFALILCLSSRYRAMFSLCVIFVVREVVMIVLGCITYQRKECVNGAMWYGKLTTVMLYAVMILLVFVPSVPEGMANWLIMLCVWFVVFALIMYVWFYVRLLRAEEQERLSATQIRTKAKEGAAHADRRDRG